MNVKYLTFLVFEWVLHLAIILCHGFTPDDATRIVAFILYCIARSVPLSLVVDNKRTSTGLFGIVSKSKHHGPWG
uniref:Uncharacterized protein n=1 Tax=Rhizophora mucronata TaxID=61149 RepID=A0A2P2N289_RHIMU